PREIRGAPLPRWGPPAMTETTGGPFLGPRHAPDRGGFPSASAGRTGPDPRERGPLTGQVPDRGGRDKGPRSGAWGGAAGAPPRSPPGGGRGGKSPRHGSEEGRPARRGDPPPGRRPAALPVPQ